MICLDTNCDLIVFHDIGRWVLCVTGISCLCVYQAESLYFFSSACIVFEYTCIINRIFTFVDPILSPKCIADCCLASYGQTNMFMMTSLKRNHFPRYWPFVNGIHRSPVNTRTNASDAEILKFSLICAWINGWVNNREAGDLSRHGAHHDVTVMLCFLSDAPILASNGTISVHGKSWTKKCNIKGL